MAKRILTHDDVSGACELALLAKYPVLTSGAGMVVTPTTTAATGEVSYAVAGATASEIQVGVVELATPAETVTGTDTTRAVTPAGVKAAIDATTSCNAPVATAAELAAITNANRITTCIGGVEKSIPMSSIIAGSAAAPATTAPITGAGTAANPFSVQASTTALSGVVELATPAETVTGTDTTRAVTPAGAAAAILASSPCGATAATAAELATVTSANLVTTCIGGVVRTIPMANVPASSTVTSAAGTPTAAPTAGQSQIYYDNSTDPGVLWFWDSVNSIWRNTSIVFTATVSGRAAATAQASNVFVPITNMTTAVTNPASAAASANAAAGSITVPVTGTYAITAGILVTADDNINHAQVQTALLRYQVNGASEPTDFWLNHRAQPAALGGIGVTLMNGTRVTRLAAGDVVTIDTLVSTVGSVNWGLTQNVFLRVDRIG